MKTSTAQAAPPRDYTRTVYRRRPGSGPAEQKKVDLDWKSGSATASDTRGFLQPADTTPDVGAKSGGREEEEGMNDPRSPRGRGVYIVGRGVGGRRPIYPRPTAPPLAAIGP
jgi:hypothetical protein